MGAEPATDHVAFYDAALERRQALMGASGARALVKNFKVFRVAAFACIGGILYGYNQGMFASVLAMPAFKLREWDRPLEFDICHYAAPPRLPKTVGNRRTAAVGLG